MMAPDIYEKLAKHLDNLPAGFPRTESGVEMRILRRLFTPEDAEFAMHLTLIPEEPRVIARRAKIPVKDAARRLEEMEKKGLIRSVPQDNNPPLYMATQFVVGFWEGQLNKLDPELVQYGEEYLDTAAKEAFWRGTPQLRTIPVNKSISIENVVMPYERAEELVRSQKSFAVQNCICRQGMHIIGKGCDKPEESCLTFGRVADSVVSTGRGRAISMEEMLAMLQRAEEVGLVLQPNNAKDPLFICTCCGCCCGVLKSLKAYPEPASVVASPFWASLNSETCKGCGLCTKRCQMEAFHLDNKKSVLDVNRCIGCGLCVSTCPTHSLSLVRKPKEKQPYVPKDFIETNIKLGKDRGKLGMGTLIGMQVRSKLDRLLAPR
ncbi:MAG TPA: 4Fe-4S dicluster domain-containing protein [Thermodesulfobacteriota bacterium]|nr:4Fe-4S dicluster domain-containing protein [Thermodesulfobacteriota bacterium]